MYEKNNEYEKYDNFFKDQISLNSNKTHKFFERQLDNDLGDLTNFLQIQYDRIERGEILQNDSNEKTMWDIAGSITTSKWNKYNAFQFYHPGIHKLFKSVRSMVVEACNHYEIDFEKEEFWAQAWFNINYNHIGKLDWHEHGGRGAPWFHGYYSVKAEPSITHYNVFDNIIENHNKNNRAILSETGHPHAMGDWDWEGPRITIAYDVVPFKGLMQGWEQHWIPLA
jgi:hypothetical protein